MNNQRRNDKRNVAECYEGGDANVTTNSEHQNQHPNTSFTWQSENSLVNHHHQANTLDTENGPLTYNHHQQIYSLQPSHPSNSSADRPPSAPKPSSDALIPFDMEYDHCGPPPLRISTPWHPQKLHRPAAPTTIHSPFATEPVSPTPDNAEWMLPHDMAAAASSPTSGLPLDRSPMSAYCSTFRSSWSPTAIVDSTICSPYSLRSGASSDTITSSGNVLQTSNVGDTQLQTHPYTLSQCQPQRQLHEHNSNCYNVGTGTIIGTSIINDNVNGPMETGAGGTSDRMTADIVHPPSYQQNHNSNSTLGIAIPFHFAPTSSPYSAPPLPAVKLQHQPQHSIRQHVPRESVMSGVLDTVARELHAQSGRLALEYTQLVQNIITMTQAGAKTVSVAAAVASAATQHTAHHQHRSPSDMDVSSASSPSASAIAAIAAAAAADHDLKTNDMMDDVAGLIHDLRDLDRLSRDVSHFQRSHNQQPQQPQQSEPPSQLHQQQHHQQTNISNSSPAYSQLGAKQQFSAQRTLM